MAEDKPSWVWRGIVPKELELTQKQQQEVIERAAAKGQSSSLWAACVLCLVVGAHFGTVAMQAYRPTSSFRWPLNEAIMIAPLAITIVSLVLLQRRARRRHLCEALREIGFRTCGQCGYWLKGLSDATPRCPECGATVPPLNS